MYKINNYLKIHTYTLYVNTILKQYIKIVWETIITVKIFLKIFLKTYK